MGAGEGSLALQIAIFFHDVVYRPDRKDNEQVSAQLALHFIETVLPVHPVQVNLKDTTRQLIL